MDDVTTSLLNANRALFERAEYEAAFHALMAVLHVADDRGDMTLVDQVSKLAKEQGEVVDAQRPPHRLSSESAARRGQSAVYKTLHLHADAIRLRHRGA